MTDAKAQARQRAVAYIARLLQMNPVHQGEEIVRARSTALGLAKSETKPVSQEVSDPKTGRRKLLESLEAIRSEFWTLPLGDLRAKLSQLSAQDYADLQVAVARLNVVAAHRGEFPKLAQKRGFDGDFFSSLKEVLIRSPRDTTVLREQVLSTFRNRSRRKSGRQMIELFKQEMPAVYALEADWFDSLHRQKAQAPSFRLNGAGRQTAASAASSGAGRYVWIFCIAISAAIRALTSHTDSSNNSYRPAPITNYPINSMPSYSPRATDGEALREGEAQLRSYLEKKRGVWKPYEQPEPPELQDPSTPRPAFQDDNRFARPRIFEPAQPGNQSHDGFPR